MSGLAPMQELRAGRYRLVSPLRVGGCGVVWRCLDTRDDVLVALKAVPLDNGGEAAVEHEAEAAARVRHPGALRVEAAFVESGHGCLVMELAACSLADVVDADGPLPEPIALRVALELCAVLGAAHAAGVVHRDVKPPNVLVLSDGTVRLGDWGIARVHASGQGHTRTGALLGTLAFMAPEQRRDPRDVRPATDLYALGATLAWMRTGAPPGDLFVPEVLASLRARVGPALADVLAEVGRHEPAERPGTADALAARIAACGEAASVDAAASYLASRARGFRADPPPVAPPTPASSPGLPAAVPPARSRRLAGVLGALVLAVAAAWGGWYGGDAAGRSAAARDPIADLPRCADAPSQWDRRVERGPRESGAADIVDVDGDGLLDVIFANTYSESATIWWGVAGGFPVEHVDVPTGRLANPPAVADVDGDGVRDLLVPLFNDAAIAVVHGRGPRMFDAPVSLPQDPPPWMLAAADLDQDSLPDLLLTARGDRSVYVRRGQRGAAFAPQQQVYDRGASEAVVFPSAAGAVAWSFDGASVARVRFGAKGVVGAVEHLALPSPVIGILRDASHPDDAVARIEHGRMDALVRVGEPTACVLGVLPSAQPVHALGDLDGDGQIDLVATVTCQFCDSNHIFQRGIP